MPEVSVIIPAHNVAAYIERAIRSVLSQTFGDLEVIVVDDGSTDDTAARVQAMGDRVICIRQPHLERAVARNVGITAAHGDYIAFLDADDYWYPQKLGRQITLLEDNRSVGIVCAWADTVGPGGEVRGVMGRDVPVGVPGADLFDWLYMGYSLPTLTVVARSAAVHEAGSFSSSVSYIEDWDLWLRIAVRHCIACVQEPLAAYQLHGRFLPQVFNEHHTQDGRLQVLARAADIYRGVRGPMPRPVCRRGQARALWYGALIDFAVGQVRSGCERSERALDSDESFFLESRASAQNMLVDFAVGLSDLGATWDQALSFTTSVLDAVPIAVHQRVGESRVLGQLSAAYAFRYYHSGDSAKARRLMSCAVQRLPVLLLNRGVLKVLSSALRPAQR